MGDPGAWTMPEQQGFPDAAGPHEHQSDFYVFVMNRKDGVLQFPELTGPEPRVRASLTLEVSHNLVAVIPLATGEICLIESTDRSS